MAHEEIRAGVEEKRISRMGGIRQQGAWTRWEQVMDRKISWSELWKVKSHRIQFLIQSGYDVLPSPTNLFSWGLIDTPAYPQCQKRRYL